MKRILAWLNARWFFLVLLQFIIVLTILAIAIIPDLFYETIDVNRGYLSYTQLDSIFFFLILGAIVLVLNLIWNVLLLIKRKWLKAFIQFICTLVLAFAVLVLGGLWAFFKQTDNFASGLTIPKNIKAEMPGGHCMFGGLGNGSKPEIIAKNSGEFEIKCGMQPGIYTYKVWLKEIPKGEVYLKVYEYTRDAELGIGYGTIVSVHNSSDTLTAFSLHGDFMIYAGNWAQTYAARYELWYKAEGSNKSTKLNQKIYLTEGWMR